MKQTTNDPETTGRSRFSFGFIFDRRDETGDAVGLLTEFVGVSTHVGLCPRARKRAGEVAAVVESWNRRDALETGTLVGVARRGARIHR